jgi:hypothetical protein
MDGNYAKEAEQLKVDLERFRGALRSCYSSPNSQVTSARLKSEISRISEKWILNFCSNTKCRETISSAVIDGRRFNFHKLVTFTERATTRSRYDKTIKEILNGYTTDVILPLKGIAQQIQMTESEVSPSVEYYRPTVFVGHSFGEKNSEYMNIILEFLIKIGLDVKTGQKSRAARVSDKVKAQIEDQEIFMGVFFRDQKIQGKGEWTTSPWVIGEMAHASAKGKKLILLVERGVKGIGGIQGDYEFHVFERSDPKIFLKIADMFQIKNFGLMQVA